MTHHENCGIKTARGNVYESLERAMEVAARVTRQAGFRIRAYRCSACGRFHVGKHTRDGRTRRPK